MNDVTHILILLNISAFFDLWFKEYCHNFLLPFKREWRHLWMTHVIKMSQHYFLCRLRIQDFHPQKSSSSSPLSSLSHPDSTFSTLEKSTCKKLKMMEVLDEFVALILVFNHYYWSTSGAGNYFRPRAILGLYLRLAGQLQLIQVNYVNSKLMK